MTDLRDPGLYRQEAARLRARAATITDSAELRDSYLALSREYESLAVVLESGQAAPETTPAPKRSRKLTTKRKQR
jgi:hypothetical protein